MEPTFDVLFALTGDVRRNSRALKQLHLLSGMGLRVRVLCYGPSAGSSLLNVPNVTLEVLPQPSGTGPPFFWRVHRRMCRAAMRHSTRVCHASDLYTLGAMARTASRYRAKLAFDSRELYTHVASAAGRPWVRLVWHLVQRRYLPRASVVFTVSGSIARQLSRSYGVADPVLLHNVPPRGTIRRGPTLRALTGAPDEDVILLHQGSIQKDRGCWLLVEAMRQVRGAILVFLGGGPLKPVLESYVRRESLGHCVRFLDPVPPDSLLSVTATADAGITLLEDTCLNHRFALPNKLFEYVMAGLPVIASDLPEIANLVRSYHIGCVVDPSRQEDLVQALQRVTSDPRQRQIWATNTPSVLNKFNWESAAERFTAAYSNLLA
ncbi:MAG: glycosyltransferase [Bacteroidota bacterium]|nr:glycosyltransferase [Bacteroidota bacterium]